ncbi:unnamed protein product [Amoebophrya sp. A120]|nr:unnamed protein product [Amoebophrya sp. A120]|eukprot:GSA120T00024670001.1
MSYPWVDVPIVDLAPFVQDDPSKSNEEATPDQPYWMSSTPTGFDAAAHTTPSGAYDFYASTASYLSSSSSSYLSFSPKKDPKKQAVSREIAAASSKYGSFWVDVSAFTEVWKQHALAVAEAAKSTTDSKMKTRSSPSVALAEPVIAGGGTYAKEKTRREPELASTGQQRGTTSSGTKNFSPLSRGSSVMSASRGTRHFSFDGRDSIPNEEPTPDVSPAMPSATAVGAGGAVTAASFPPAAAVLPTTSSSPQKNTTAATTSPISAAATLSTDPYSFSFPIPASTFSSDYFATDPFASVFGDSTVPPTPEILETPAQSPEKATTGVRTGTTDSTYYYTTATSARSEDAAATSSTALFTTSGSSASSASTTTKQDKQKSVALGKSTMALKSATPADISVTTSSNHVDRHDNSPPPEQGYHRDTVLQGVKNLFETVSQKDKELNAAWHQPQRGYIPFGAESGSAAFFENKEGFAYGFSGWSDFSTSSGTSQLPTDKQISSAALNDKNLPQNDMEGYNVWAKSLDGGTKNLLEKQLFSLFVAVGEALVRAYSLHLYEDEALLADKWKGGETISLARVFRYFETPNGEEIRKRSKSSIAHQSMTSPSRKIVRNSGSFRNSPANSSFDSNSPNAMDRLSATQLRQLNDESQLKSLGSSPHTDWGLLTLITADDVPGLQLCLDGVYHTVKPRFDQNLLFVNCGDFMSLLSCGKFLSPIHRVLSPGSFEVDGGHVGSPAMSSRQSGSPKSQIDNFYSKRRSKEVRDVDDAVAAATSSAPASPSAADALRGPAGGGDKNKDGSQESALFPAESSAAGGDHCSAASSSRRPSETETDTSKSVNPDMLLSAAVGAMEQLHQQTEQSANTDPEESGTSASSATATDKNKKTTSASVADGNKEQDSDTVIKQQVDDDEPGVQQQSGSTSALAVSLPVDARTSNACSPPSSSTRTPDLQPEEAETAAHDEKNSAITLVVQTNAASQIDVTSGEEEQGDAIKSKDGGNGSATEPDQEQPPQDPPQTGATALDKVNSSPRSPSRTMSGSLAVPGGDSSDVAGEPEDQRAPRDFFLDKTKFDARGSPGGDAEKQADVVKSTRPARGNGKEEEQQFETAFENPESTQTQPATEPPGSPFYAPTPFQENARSLETMAPALPQVLEDAGFLKIAGGNIRTDKSRSTDVVAAPDRHDLLTAGGAPEKNEKKTSDVSAETKKKLQDLFQQEQRQEQVSMTNARTNSTNSVNNRYSVVFFYYPNYDAKIPPPPKSQGRQVYSVFTDQSGRGEQYQNLVASIGSFAEIHNLSFGSWIKKKWESVSRKK